MILRDAIDHYVAWRRAHGDDSFPVHALCTNSAKGSLTR